MKQPRRLYLDFAVPTRRAALTGATLCLFGVAAAVAVAVGFEATLAERSRLDAEIGALAQPRRTASPADARTATETAAIESELGIPWTALLAELETASQDTASSVSLLEVEPDPGKHVVRITAEVRALPDALAYLDRLQHSRMLRYPMLESHERRKDDPEHPVRIKLAAEWRT